MINITHIILKGFIDLTIYLQISIALTVAMTSHNPYHIKKEHRLIYKFNPKYWLCVNKVDRCNYNKYNTNTFFFFCNATLTNIILGTTPIDIYV